MGHGAAPVVPLPESRARSLKRKKTRKLLLSQEAGSAPHRFLLESCKLSMHAKWRQRPGLLNRYLINSIIYPLSQAAVIPAHACLGFERGQKKKNSSPLAHAGRRPSDSQRSSVKQKRKLLGSLPRKAFLHLYDCTENT